MYLQNCTRINIVLNISYIKYVFTKIHLHDRVLNIVYIKYVFTKFICIIEYKVSINEKYE